MTEMVVALLMFVNGEIKEARLQTDNGTMSYEVSAGVSRHVIKWQTVTYKCWKGSAELESKYRWQQNQLKNSSSNKVAKHLRDRRYRQIVIRNKKAYNRKKHEDYSRDS